MSGDETIIPKPRPSLQDKSEMLFDFGGFFSFDHLHTIV